MNKTVIALNKQKTPGGNIGSDNDVVLKDWPENIIHYEVRQP
ncbi:hypothetical protein [Tatumella ptyseos]|nr:hypothetical protein [Tatumella ptyseos]